MSFQQFLSILRGRWHIVSGSIAAVALLALALSLVMPDRYTASASVLVDFAPDPVAGTAMPMPLAEVMQTQEDIASSERVAQRVVTALGLNNDPRARAKWLKSTGGRGDFAAWLSKGLLKDVSVPPTIETNILTINAKAADPKFAAALANGFAQAYIDTTVELRMQPAKQYSVLFDESARALRADLEAKQKLLSDYENSHGLIADDRLDVETTRLGELSTQLVAIQGQVQESQSRQHSVKAGDDARPEILQNQLIENLKADVARAEAKQEVLATQLGTNHPDYVRNEAELTSLRDRLARESTRVVASLGAVTQANQRREADVLAAFTAQKQRVLELKHQHDEASMLQNDVTTAQRNLEAVSQRLAQTNLQARTPQANVALLTPASEPLERSSPHILLNVLIGILLGAVLGTGTALWLEHTDRRVRSDADLVQMLGLPVLGRIYPVAYEQRGARQRLAGPNPRKALAH